MNTEDMLKIDLSWMTDYFEITIAFFMISVLMKVILSQKKPDVSDAGDLVFSVLKFIGYGFLAGFIYFYSIEQGIKEVDVLTFFTFVLATFEAAHCLSIIVSALIKSLMVFSDIDMKKR